MSTAPHADPSDDGSIGVYVHLPFCERICPYCDFAVVAARPLQAAVERRYVEALVRELSERAAPLAGRGLASVYFGGGTPALFTPGAVARLLDAIRRAFPVETSREATPTGRAALEVTLEANPSTLERERLSAFVDAGVNRLSLGVQSFDDDVLRRLGRAHRAEASHAAIEAARAAGFSDLSLDLIFAAPGSTTGQLERDLDAVVRHAPEHLSTYELTIENGTPFALARDRGQLGLPAEESVIEMGVRIGERLVEAGLRRYEISSHARPGFEARHNRRYWQRKPVLGLGMGAWSALPPSVSAPHGAREGNERGLDAYLCGVGAGGTAVATREITDLPTARGEAVFLGLRQLDGLDLAAFAAEFGAAPEEFFAEAIERLQADELIETSAGRLRLTERGRWFADSVAGHFV